MSLPWYMQENAKRPDWVADYRGMRATPAPKPLPQASTATAPAPAPKPLPQEGETYTRTSTTGFGPFRRTKTEEVLTPKAEAWAAKREKDTEKAKQARTERLANEANQEYYDAMEEVWGNLENEGSSAYVKEKETGRHASEEVGYRRKAARDRINAMYEHSARETLRREREKKDRKEKVVALDLAEWSSFSPLKQAVVQSNADLMSATAYDREMGGKHQATPEELEVYNEQVAKLFPHENTSVGVNGVWYAPETVAFLTERGMTSKDLAGLTLDDFLLNDTAINARLLADIDTPVEQPYTSTGAELTYDASGMPTVNVQEVPLSRRDQRRLFAQRLGQGQLAYQERNRADLLKNGDQLLTNMTQRTTNKAAEQYGGTLRDRSNLQVTPEEAKFLNAYLTDLARGDLDPMETISQIQLNFGERGLSPEQQKRQWDVMLETVTSAALGDSDWFTDYQGEGEITRTPQEVAQQLGMASLKTGEG